MTEFVVQPDPLFFSTRSQPVSTDFSFFNSLFSLFLFFCFLLVVFYVLDDKSVCLGASLTVKVDDQDKDEASFRSAV